jgi:hypothetical protein
MANSIWSQWKIDEDVRNLLTDAPRVIIAKSRSELFDLASGNGRDVFPVKYSLPNGGTTQEAVVVKCKNGLAWQWEERS